MNKVRIIGLIMLLIGIIIQYTFENDGIDFFYRTFNWEWNSFTNNRKIEI
jgi:hypothetical protein